MNSAKRGLNKRMFSDIKQDSVDKFLRIKLFLEETEQMEPAPPTIPSDFYNALKGFFFVYVYGIFESSVVATIARTIDCLNATGVSISQCKQELLSLVLSPEYDALANVGEGKKWPKRWEISKKLSEDSNIYIEESLFPTDGRNIQKKQLESLKIEQKAEAVRKCRKQKGMSNSEIAMQAGVTESFVIRVLGTRKLNLDR